MCDSVGTAPRDDVTFYTATILPLNSVTEFDLNEFESPLATDVRREREREEKLALALPLTRRAGAEGDAPGAALQHLLSGSRLATTSLAKVSN